MKATISLFLALITIAIALFFAITRKPEARVQEIRPVQHVPVQAPMKSPPGSLSPSAESVRTWMGCASHGVITFSGNSLVSKVGNRWKVDRKLWTSFLQYATEFSDLFILVCVSSDRDEEDVRKLLESEDITSKTCNQFHRIVQHRVLFYESKLGRIAMVRQLRPSVHFEDELEVCIKLSPFVPSLHHLDQSPKDSSSKSSQLQTNINVYSSLPLV